MLIRHLSFVVFRADHHYPELLVSASSVLIRWGWLSFWILLLTTDRVWLLVSDVSEYVAVNRAPDAVLQLRAR